MRRQHSNPHCLPEPSRSAGQADCSVGTRRRTTPFSKTLRERAVRELAQNCRRRAPAPLIERPGWASRTPWTRLQPKQGAPGAAPSLQAPGGCPSTEERHRGAAQRSAMDPPRPAMNRRPSMQELPRIRRTTGSTRASIGRDDDEWAFSPLPQNAAAPREAQPHSDHYAYDAKSKRWRRRTHVARRRASDAQYRTRRASWCAVSSSKGALFHAKDDAPST